MNLTKLFEAQRELQEYKNFKYEGEDKFDKMVLALLVEIGELANEHRGFKYWSEDQEPRTAAKCRNCYGFGKGYFSGEKYTGLKEVCVECSGTGKDESESPLLEEYVDGMHFVLGLGLEIGVVDFVPTRLLSFTNDITRQFKSLYKVIANLELAILLIDKTDYRILFNNYLHLGEMLGFTWEQIEEAYFQKNKINYQRQDQNY